MMNTNVPKTITITQQGLITFVISAVTLVGKFTGMPAGVESDLVQVTSFVLGAHVLGKAYNLKK